MLKGAQTMTFANIIGKVKQSVGSGGVKVVCKVADRLSRSGGFVSGELQLTSKSDQLVTELKVELTEEYSTGRGDTKSTVKIPMGDLQLPANFQIKAGESKVVEFVLPYRVAKSTNDRMAEQGGLLGAMGKVGRFMDAEKSRYKLSASAWVKGTFIPPTHEIAMAMAA